MASGFDTRRLFFHGFLSDKRRQRTAELEELQGAGLLRCQFDYRQRIAADCQPFPLPPSIGIRATILIYVPPHDVQSVLDDAVTVLGADRGAALARELTKIHEEVVRGTLGTLRDRFDPEKEGGQTPRGEFVLVLAPPAESEGGGGHPAPSEQAIRRALRDAMAEGLRRSAAASHVAQVLGVPRRAVYRLSLEMDSNGSE